VFRTWIADVHRPREQRPIDLHVAIPAGLEVCADELMRLAFKNFNDFAFAVSAANVSLARDGHEHGIARGGVARLIGGNENVTTAIGGRRASIGPHETISSAHAAEDTGDTLAGEFFARDAAGAAGFRAGRL